VKKKAKDKVKIIAVVGMAGSGKTTVCDFLGKKGIPVLRFGDETDTGLSKLGKKINEKNEKWYREKVRRELGMEAYAVKIKPRVEAMVAKSDIIVLDGLYSWEEYVYLREHFDNLILLGVYTQPKDRYLRLTKRKIRRLTDIEARERDMAELVRLHKGGPIALCDYLIVNEGKISDLKKKVERFYQTLVG